MIGIVTLFFSLHLFAMMKCGHSTMFWKSNQKLISETIEKTFNEFPHQKALLKYAEQTRNSNSAILKLCDLFPSLTNFDDHNERVGCCQPSTTRYMYDVRIANGKLHIYNADPKLQQETWLPPIRSVYHQHFLFNLSVEFHKEPLPVDECKIFHGTLHVTAIQSIFNVYHAVVDNVIPLAEQILLDAYLDPSYLHAPRMMLLGFHPPVLETISPHFQIRDQLMSAGTINLQQANNTCFKRVVWGRGALVNYHSTRVLMRRMAATFLRHFTLHKYNINPPTEFVDIAHTHNNNNIMLNAQGQSPEEKQFVLYNQTVTPNFTNIDGSQLKVVIFSRGRFGVGRSLEGEDMLLQTIKKFGGNAIIYENYAPGTFTKQIALAAHADVVIGIHGAALVHFIFGKRGSIFVELKTIFAYEAPLFPILSDAREGVFVGIDIRSYAINRVQAHKKLDNELIHRILNGMHEANELRKAGVYSGVIKNLSPKVNANVTHPDFLVNMDFVSGPMKMDSQSFYHILGPKLSEIDDVCKQTVFYRYIDFLGADGIQRWTNLHCAKCGLF